MKVVKVFTKYDQPFISINVPVFRNLEAKPRSDVIDFTTGIYYEVLQTIRVEQGLEGVIFITYEGRV